MSLAPDLAALSPWASQLARTFVSLDSDIALVIDDDGVILDAVQRHGDPLADTPDEWIGRPWVDTVTGETRVKIERLLADVAASGVARRREVNHTAGGGDGIPVAYAAVRLGEHGPVLAAGRDLRAISAIQQRFVDAQRDLERDYWAARHAESRYRLLFQVATDGVVVVDAQTLRIIEANVAASRLFDRSAAQLTGHELIGCFESHSRSAVEALLVAARSSGEAGEIRARLAGTVTAASVAATPFRGAQSLHLLVRVREVDGPATLVELGQSLARLVDEAHEGVVVTDSSGRILAANPAFVELAQAGSELALKGLPLGEQGGVSRADVDALMGTVRRDGLARRSGVALRTDRARPLRADVSAALLTEGDQECIGLMFHGVQALPTATSCTAEVQPLAALEQLAERLGQAPLDTLRREASELVDRFLLQAALDRSAGDEAVAAALLGLSLRGFQERRAAGSSGSRPA